MRRMMNRSPKLPAVAAEQKCMRVMGVNPWLLTDSDIDTLAWEFLKQPYFGAICADWSPDPRLDTFLRRRGLSPVTDDGDLCNIVLDRSMTYVRVVPPALPAIAQESPVGARRVH